MSFEGAWTNQVQNILIVGGVNAGVYIYSGSPGPGNPPIASVSDGGTDPFGNAVEAGIVSQSGGNSAALFGAALVFSGGTFISGTAAALVLGGVLGANILHTVLPWDTPLFAVQPGTTVTEETWHSMSAAGFLNGWANTAGNVVAQYRYVVSPPKSVEIIGAINAAAATATTFFQLPSGYIPASQQQVAAEGTGGVTAGASCFIGCDTSGNLTVHNGTIGAANSYLFHGLISLDA